MFDLRTEFRQKLEYQISSQHLKEQLSFWMKRSHVVH